MFFSVVIPVFNRADLIGATLDSIFNQAFDECEVIVVDDGSTDETVNVLQKYGDRISIFQQKNRGPGAARNLGISHAQGDYVVFLDSDDLWFPWTLATYKQAICDNQFPAFLTGSGISFQDYGEVQAVSLEPLKTTFFSDYYASSHQPFCMIGTCSAVAVQTRVLREVGGFTEQKINAEDSDLWLKLGTASGFLFIQSPSIFAYRQHLNSAVSDHTRNYQGNCHLIQQERDAQYPGAADRQRERLSILTRHTRPISLECLRRKEIARGWKVYQDTFRWNLQLFRIRYLVAFWLILSFTQLTRAVDQPELNSSEMNH
jgi:glycosyltransferase involved in cell wall biosynthesis